MIEGFKDAHADKNLVNNGTKFPFPTIQEIDRDKYPNRSILCRFTFLTFT